MALAPLLLKLLAGTEGVKCASGNGLHDVVEWDAVFGDLPNGQRGRVKKQEGQLLSNTLANRDSHFKHFRARKI